MSTSTAAVPVAPRTNPRVSKKQTISTKERELRAAAVAGANGHNAMEGFHGSPALTNLQTKYIGGEIEIDDAVQALKQSYSFA